MKRLCGLFSLRYSQLPGLIALLGLLLSLPLFMDDIYYINLVTEITIIALFTISFNLLMGYTGLISLGHAAYFGIGAYATAVLLKTWSPSIILTLGLAILITSVIALFIGWMCIRAAEIYFVFLTLAFAQMIYTIIYYWDALTGGDDGLPGIVRPLIKPFNLFSIQLSDPTNFYYFTLTIVALAIFACWMIVNSPFGGVLQAIRENPERVQFIGLNLKRYKLEIFVISSAFAGLSGSLYSVYQGFISPEILFWTKSAESILMTLLGGLYSFLGPALGAAVLIFLKDIILNYTQSWKLFLGAALVLIIMFSPGGILGIIESQLSNLAKRYNAAK